MLGKENNKTKFSTIWEDMDEGFDEYQQASGENDLFYSSHYLVRNEQEIAELSFFNYIFYCFPPTLRYLHNFF